jgi:hypothetical protein
VAAIVLLAWLPTAVAARLLPVIVSADALNGSELMR